MKKTFISLVLLLSALTYAKTPNVLAYEKILNSTMEKENPSTVQVIKSQPTLLPPPAVLAARPGIDGSVPMNVTGVTIINGKATAWFINKDNKTMRATEGMTVENKKLTAINQFGVQFKNTEGKEGFLPLITSAVSESDVVFSSGTKGK